MRSKRISWIALMMAMVFIFGISVSAYAHDVPDMNKRGSITFTMRHDDTLVGGGTLTIYRVGEIAEDDGNYSFIPTGSFVDCGKSFEDLSAVYELAEDLVEYAQTNSIPALSTENIGADGKVSFTDLELGLYLIVQEEAADGYMEIAPFLMSIPTMEDGTYKYDLSAEPKTELKEEEPTPTPTPTSTPTPTPPPDLPQTGMLWWPVPLFVFGGLCMLAIGVFLIRGREKNEN